MLHLLAVEKILNKLDPPLEGKRVSLYSDEKSLGVWLNSVRNIRNAIESTLCIPSQHEVALSLRLKWQRVQTFQLFTEHILLEHPNLIPFAKRLYLTLGNYPNFLKISPIKTLKKTLNNILKKNKVDPKETDKFKKNSTNLFTEVVFRLCFGQSGAPEDELVKMLLDIVFTKDKEKTERAELDGTRELTPLEDEDETPIIRSFLLQLLLEHTYVPISQSISAGIDHKLLGTTE
jgi:hypothetical protein